MVKDLVLGPSPCVIYFVSTVGKAFCVWQDKILLHCINRNPNVQRFVLLSVSHRRTPLCIELSKYRGTQEPLKGYREDRLRESWSHVHITACAADVVEFLKVRTPVSA